MQRLASLPPFSTPLVDPVFEYSHAVGRSITGGYVYRGASLGSTYRGRYFYADFIDNRVWSLRLTVNTTTGEATATDVIEHTAALGEAAASPASKNNPTVTVARRQVWREPCAITCPSLNAARKRTSRFASPIWSTHAAPACRPQVWCNQYQQPPDY